MAFDVRYGLRWLGAFVTGRGVTMLAVGLASVALGGAGGWIVPVVGLVIGVPLGAMMATMSQHHKQEQLLDEYRDQIGGVLGKQPREVTMDDLRMVAHGSPDHQLPGNRALNEALTRIDRHRAISFISNAVSAVLAVGLVFGLMHVMPPEAITWMSNHLPSLSFANLPGSSLVFGAISSVASVGLDTVMRKIGHSMYGFDQPSLNDRVHIVARHLHRGQGISQEQMMGLIAEANPGVDREIRNRYGLSYHQLPANHLAEVVAKYQDEFKIQQNTSAVNLGLLPPQEIPFIIEGRRSGAYPDVGPLLERYHLEHPVSHHGSNIFQQMGQRVADAVTHGYHHATEAAGQFVNKVTAQGHGPRTATARHAERIEHERHAAASASQSAVAPTFH